MDIGGFYWGRFKGWKRAGGRAGAYMGSDRGLAWIQDAFYRNVYRFNIAGTHESHPQR